MFFPKKIEISACQQTMEPVLWTWPKPSSSSSSLLVLLIHLTEKRQYSPALASTVVFEILPPQRERDWFGEVAKHSVYAAKKY